MDYELLSEDLEDFIFKRGTQMVHIDQFSKIVAESSNLKPRG
jgi:hypothetical protein